MKRLVIGMIACSCLAAVSFNSASAATVSKTKSPFQAIVREYADSVDTGITITKPDHNSPVTILNDKTLVDTLQTMSAPQERKKTEDSSSVKSKSIEAPVSAQRINKAPFTVR